MYNRRSYSLGFLQWQRKAFGLTTEAADSMGDRHVLDYDESLISRHIHPGIIDSHCHLDFIFARMKQRHHTNFPSFKAFTDKFQPEFPPSFSGCIAVFCEPSKWMKYGVEEAVNRDSNVWKTFGVHPHYAKDYDIATHVALTKLLELPRVVALGEIGLDYSSKNSSDRRVQQRVFDAQLRLAMEYKLPVCLHIREADEDGLQILKEVGLPSTYAIHLHCFNGTWEHCQVWLKNYPNLKVGFTPLITFKNVTHLHEVIRRIPLEKILLETDSPYFVPRQISNCDRSIDFSHPGFVVHTAAQVAKLKNVPIEDVAKAHQRNLFEVYKIDAVLDSSNACLDAAPVLYNKGKEVD